MSGIEKVRTNNKKWWERYESSRSRPSQASSRWTPFFHLLAARLFDLDENPEYWSDITREKAETLTQTDLPEDSKDARFKAAFVHNSGESTATAVAYGITPQGDWMVWNPPTASSAAHKSRHPHM